MPFEIRPANEQLPDPESEPIRPKVARVQPQSDPFENEVPLSRTNEASPLSRRLSKAEIEVESARYAREQEGRTRRDSRLYPGDDYYGAEYGSIWDSLIFGNRHSYGWSSEYRMMRFAAGVVFSILYLLIRGCS